MATSYFPQFSVYLLVIVVITDKPLVVTSYIHCVTSECQWPLVLSLVRFASFRGSRHRDTSILIVGECSAFLASGSDRTDDRRRKVNCPVFLSATVNEHMNA